jgi:small subunit ribosomal protein S11
MATLKKRKKNFHTAIIHIHASFTNTIVTVTDTKGSVLSWASAGSCGFKGARKKTPFAAQVAAENATRQSIERGVKKAEVRICGPGPGREPALRGLYLTGLGIKTIRDVTPVPHNGCRPPNKRRI